MSATAKIAAAPAKFRVYHSPNGWCVKTPDVHGAGVTCASFSVAIQVMDLTIALWRQHQLRLVRERLSAPESYIHHDLHTFATLRCVVEPPTSLHHEVVGYLFDGDAAIKEVQVIDHHDYTRQWHAVLPAPEYMHARECVFIGADYVRIHGTHYTLKPYTQRRL